LLIETLAKGIIKEWIDRDGGTDSSQGVQS
jgi:hypothetical protein